MDFHFLKASFLVSGLCQKSKNVNRGTPDSSPHAATPCEDGEEGLGHLGVHEEWERGRGWVPAPGMAGAGEGRKGVVAHLPEGVYPGSVLRYAGQHLLGREQYKLSGGKHYLP